MSIQAFCKSNNDAMTGIVVQDLHTHANAIYSVGMNLASGSYSLSDTNYKFDETRITVELPYPEYIRQ
jgi:hypothetical protein